MDTHVLKKLSTALALAMMIALGSSTSAVRGSTRFSYTVTELGTLPGYTDSDVYGINDLGQAVGASQSKSNYEAFLWENGKMTDLGTLGGKNSEALHINNRRQVVGESQTSSGDHHAFLWENGKMTDLGTLGGKNSEARYINNRGQVVGESQTSSGSLHAFLWENGKMTDLVPLSNTNSFANAVNDKGQVVGNQISSDHYTYQVFLWENGKMKSLADLGGGDSFAYSINNKGQVVGSSTTEKGYGHCVLWSGGTIQDITPRLQDGEGFGLACEVTSINNRGTFVGFVNIDSVYVAHFIWHDGKAVTFDIDKRVMPINSDGFLTTIQGINNKGQIAINGFDKTGKDKAYLLTPTWVTQ